MTEDRTSNGLGFYPQPLFLSIHPRYVFLLVIVHLLSCSVVNTCRWKVVLFSMESFEKFSEGNFVCNFLKSTKLHLC